MHATAPVSNPAMVTQDKRNPILVPGGEGFDSTAVEYPFPFLNPADGRYYMYYRGKGMGVPEQTGLLVRSGDMGQWTRVKRTPVISAVHEFESMNVRASHTPSQFGFSDSPLKDTRASYLAA